MNKMYVKLAKCMFIYEIKMYVKFVHQTPNLTLIVSER